MVHEVQPLVVKNRNYDTSKTIKANPNSVVKSIPRQQRYPIYKKPRKVQTPILLEPVSEAKLFSYLDQPNIDKHVYIDSFLEHKNKKLKDKRQEDIRKLKSVQSKSQTSRYIDEATELQDIKNLDIRYTATERYKHDISKQLSYDQTVSDKWSRKPIAIKSEVQKCVEKSANKNQFYDSSEDFIILLHFFTQFVVDSTDYAPKLNLVNALKVNRKICLLYNLSEHRIQQLLLYKTATPKYISEDEFINFMIYPEHLVIHSDYENYGNYEVKGVIQFSDEFLNELNKAYTELDTEGKQRVECTRLANKYLQMKQLLFLPVFMVDGIERIIKFNKFLYEFKTFHNMDEESLISWDQFVQELSNYGPFNIQSLKYLKPQTNEQSFTLRYTNNLPRKDMVLLGSSIVSKDKQRDILLENIFFDNLHTIFNQCEKRYGKFVQRQELLDCMDASIDLRSILSHKVRNHATNLLPIETVGQTINRMRIELDNYIDYDDVVDFFTIRGRPLELEETLKKIPITKTKKVKEEIKEQANSPKKSKEFKEQNKIHITVPIDSRVTHDYRKSKTQRQIWIEKELVRKKQKEEEAISYKIQPIEMPTYIYDERMTKFYRKQSISDEETKSFKACPMPFKSGALLYDKMMQESKSKQKIVRENRKLEYEEMLQQDHPIKNMLKRTEENIIKQTMDPDRARRYSQTISRPSDTMQFHKSPVNDAPDFEKIHGRLYDYLAEIRNPLPKTNTAPFLMTDLHMSTPDLPLNYIEEGGQRLVRNTKNQLKKIQNVEQKMIYGNRKHEDLVDYRRKQKFDAYKKLSTADDECKSWKAERLALIPKGKGQFEFEHDTYAQQQQKIHDQVHMKRQFERGLEKGYHNKVKEIEQRVQERPLISFTPSDKNVHLRGNESWLNKTNDENLKQFTRKKVSFYD